MAGGYFHSIRFLRSQCQGCVTCVKACPTEAIRVRNGKAELIESRCIDCGECLRRCGYHAIVAETDKLEEIEQFKYNIALPPPSYMRVPTEISAAAIWEGLHRLGLMRFLMWRWLRSIYRWRYPIILPTTAVSAGP